MDSDFDAQLAHNKQRSDALIPQLNAVLGTEGVTGWRVLRGWNYLPASEQSGRREEALYHTPPLDHERARSLGLELEARVNQAFGGHWPEGVSPVGVPSEDSDDRAIIIPLSLLEALNKRDIRLDLTELRARFDAPQIAYEQEINPLEKRLNALSGYRAWRKSSPLHPSEGYPVGFVMDAPRADSDAPLIAEHFRQFAAALPEHPLNTMVIPKISSDRDGESGDLTVSAANLKELDAAIAKLEGPLRVPFQSAMQHLLLDGTAWDLLVEWNGRTLGSVTGEQRAVLMASRGEQDTPARHAAWLEDKKIWEALVSKCDRRLGHQPTARAFLTALVAEAANDTKARDQLSSLLVHVPALEQFVGAQQAVRTANFAAKHTPRNPLEPDGTGPGLAA